MTLFCGVCDQKVEPGTFYEVQVATCVLKEDGTVDYPTYSAKMYICTRCKKIEDDAMDPQYGHVAENN